MVLIIMALGVLVIAGSQSDRTALNSNHSPPTSKYPPLIDPTAVHSDSLNCEKVQCTITPFSNLLPCSFQCIVVLYFEPSAIVSSRMAWQIALLSVLF